MILPSFRDDDLIGFAVPKENEADLLNMIEMFGTVDNPFPNPPELERFTTQIDFFGHVWTVLKGKFRSYYYRISTREIEKYINSGKDYCFIVVDENKSNPVFHWWKNEPDESCFWIQHTSSIQTGHMSN